MNAGLQIDWITKAFRRAGVESDRYDISEHVDPTLTLGENIRNLERVFGLRLRGPRYW